MIYLLFSSEDDNPESPRNFVEASDCEESLIDDLHDLLSEGWSRCLTWWITETDFNYPYNNITKLVRSRD